jgi:hypothetical protein
LARLLHMHHSLRRLLKKTDEELDGLVATGDGVPLSGGEVRILITAKVEGGVNYLQQDEACDCFSSARGCAGHELARKEAVA